MLLIFSFRSAVWLLLCSGLCVQALNPFKSSSSHKTSTLSAKRSINRKAYDDRYDKVRAILSAKTNPDFEEQSTKKAYGIDQSSVIDDVSDGDELEAAKVGDNNADDDDDDDDDSGVASFDSDDEDDELSFMPKQSQDINIVGALEASKVDKSKSITCWFQAGGCEDIAEPTTTSGKRLDLRRAYKRVNRQLESMLETDDVKTNMRALQAWLNRELGREVKPETRTLVEALENLSELTHRNSLDKCTATIRSTLATNDKWLGSDSIKRLQFGETPRTRLGKIVYHYAQEHSKECQKHYWDQFQEHKSKIVNKEFEQVRAFLGDILAQRVRKMIEKHQLNLPEDQQTMIKTSTDLVPWIHKHSKQLSKFISKMRPLHGHEDAVIALRWLRSIAHQRKDAKIKFLRRTDEEVDKLKFVEVFLNYLVKPCENYRKSLRDTFGNVDFDIIRVESSTFDPLGGSGGLKFIKSSIGRSHRSSLSGKSTGVETIKDEPKNEGEEFFQVLLYYDACDKLLVKKEQLVIDITKLVNKKL